MIGRAYFRGVEPCKKCGCYTLYESQVGPHIGIYCANCHKWQQWLSHKEINKYSILTDEAMVPQFIVVNEYDTLLQETNAKYGGELK